ncbi:MAG TPA: hypothetical protein VFS12_05360 [Terriglobia bacterium]|nr:hypothetical protein [Terriglobia bacterium]
MFNYKQTLQKMRRERASMLAELDKLDQAIAALQALVGNAAPARTKSTLSAKDRSGAKANRNNLGKEKNAKRKISAEGLRNIIRAQNKRWAKVRAAAKAKAMPSAAK